MVIPDEREALDTAIEGVPESFPFPPMLTFSGILSLLCTLHTLSAPSGYAQNDTNIYEEPVS